MGTRWAPAPAAAATKSAPPPTSYTWVLTPLNGLVHVPDNDKGRIHFAIMNEEPIREPREAEWITTSMDANDVDELLRHNGTYRTTNVFYRAQSGLSTLREDQRAKLGPPNDFRHNILMHKTTEHNVTGDMTLLIGVPFISGRAHPVGYLRSPLIILRRVKGSAFPTIWMSISCQEV